MRCIPAFISVVALSVLAAWSTSTWSTPVEVAVFQAKDLQYKNKLTLSGTVEAKQNATLASLEAGVVNELLVEVGDVVKRGQALLKLDPTLAKLRLEQSEASVESADVALLESKRQLDEVESLSKKQFVAPTLLAERRADVAASKAALAKAKAALAMDKETLRRQTLFAPFDGVVMKRNVDLGEWVTTQTHTLTLVSVGDLRLKVAVPQEYINAFSNNNINELVIQPDHDQSKFIAAKVQAIVPVINEQTRSFVVHVEVPKQESFIAGMSAQAQFELPSTGTQAVWVPKSALKYHPDGALSVFVANGNSATRHTVRVLEQRGEQVLISVVSGDSTVLSGPIIMTAVQLLKNGSEITVSKD
ncbi:efflux RND transporter periplasmic adaptor subunit [Pseudoalteromonas luteoviolacea]|uniref:efflux RND transporter periplasmic adaptor subunit n=1 Tax=Pseudoalteromonas luteoviolacea TaxID=43657 RepID=UPI001B387025|nr:efflux RND transporter periplasmic adaptor subunit [Pseudoalteromonas luteoviolacea]MBQ4834737.1 efflux RND transporter periplasmic adaptor subunit [Pseudoalteromonas luteoviolacea]